MFARGGFLLETVWEALVLGLFSQPLFWIAYFSFYISLYPSSSVHVWVRLSRTDTCPISPYPKWLGVVVKAEEYGPVRCKMLYCSTGSLLLGPLLHCARPFLLGALWDAEDKIVLGYIRRPFGLSVYVLGNASPRLGLWALI